MNVFRIPFLCLYAVLSLIFCGCSDDNSGVEVKDAELPSLAGDYSLEARALRGELFADTDFVAQSVTLFELDSSLSVKDSLKGSISVVSTSNHDSVMFSFPVCDYESPYVLVSVNGYYQNGENKAPAAFRLVSDISRHWTINVSLLSDLETPRVFYLCQKKLLPFAAAKQKAAWDLFSQFEMNATLQDAESRSPDSTGVFRAAFFVPYYALSLGNLDSAFVTAKDKFADDLKTDGVWNDSLAKLRAADYFLSWKMAGVKLKSQTSCSDEYYDKFERSVHHLGECDAENLRTRFVDTITASKFYGDTVICAYDSKKRANLWRLMTAQETRLGYCGPGEAAPRTLPDSDGIYYTCDSLAPYWHLASRKESLNAQWGFCDKSDGGHFGVYRDTFYRCSAGYWFREDDSLNVFFDYCTASREGETNARGNVKYTCRNGKWTLATSAEIFRYDLNQVIRNDSLESRKRDDSSAAYVYVVPFGGVRYYYTGHPDSVGSRIDSIVYDSSGVKYKVLQLGKKLWINEPIVSGTASMKQASVDKIMLLAAVNGDALNSSSSVPALIPLNPTYLYGFSTFDGAAAVCPSGFRLPDTTEWRAAIRSGSSADSTLSGLFPSLYIGYTKSGVSKSAEVSFYWSSVALNSNAAYCVYMNSEGIASARFVKSNKNAAFVQPRCVRDFL